MIKFFRKIRQKLLTENKVSKYLIYAIGEIVLVIIGILIALQINNQNEQRKTENKIISILKEVQNDLVKDVKKAEEQIDYFVYKDSIINLILNNKLTAIDYQNDVSNNLVFLISDIDHMKVHPNGYNNLIKSIDNIPEHLKDIIAPLNEIYINNKYEIDKFDERADVITNKYIDYLSENKNWYFMFNLIENDHNYLTDEVINYFLNDPFYKNRARTYQNTLGSQAYWASIFKKNAIDAIRLIAKRIGNEDDFMDFIPHNLIPITNDQLQEYTGDYELTEIEGHDFNSAIGTIFKMINFEDHLKLFDPTFQPDRETSTRIGHYFLELDKTFAEYRGFNATNEFIRDASNIIVGISSTINTYSGEFLASWQFKKVND